MASNVFTNGRSIQQLPGYNKMPFDGKDGPDACQIAIIKAWVNAGAPNN